MHKDKFRTTVPILDHIYGINDLKCCGNCKHPCIKKTDLACDDWEWDDKKSKDRLKPLTSLDANEKRSRESAKKNGINDWGGSYIVKERWER